MRYFKAIENVGMCKQGRYYIQHSESKKSAGTFMTIMTDYRTSLPFSFNRKWLEPDLMLMKELSHADAEELRKG